jgi:hypothetical protein
MIRKLFGGKGTELPKHEQKPCFYCRTILKTDDSRYQLTGDDGQKLLCNRCFAQVASSGSLLTARLLEVRLNARASFYALRTA